jgi:predicted HD phosphohydrolase
MPASLAQPAKRTYEILRALQREMPSRILGMLRQLECLPEAHGISQLEHALQTATRAYRASAPDEMVLCALCHDIGKAFGQLNHAAMAAELLKPFVSEDSYNIVRTHDEFQGRYYFHLYGMDRMAYRAYKKEPWFSRALQFSTDWDMASFDTTYRSKPLDEFEPLVRQYFGIEFPWVLQPERISEQPSSVS